MNKKFLLVCLISASLTVIISNSWAEDAMPGKAFAPISSSCEAQTDAWGAGGKCNVPEQCFEAPEGHIIMEESLQVSKEDTKSWENTECNWNPSGYAKVKIRFKILNKVCVTGYAHSKSGMSHANAHGGVKCTLTGRYDVIPPM